MKRTLLFIIIVLVSTSLYSQFYAYYPNGKKIPDKYNTEHSCMRSILDSLGFKETESYNIGGNDVFFKRLTNKPVLIILNKNNPLKIPQLISSCQQRYKRYKYSYSYYYDLRSMKDSCTLTKEYLHDAFGKPDLDYTNEDGEEVLIFNKENARITYKDNRPTSVDVIDYNAIYFYKLSIPEFSVTGESYSMGFDISVLNESKKTIKYISFTVKATNQVDDLVGTKTVRGVGPIKSGDAGSYSFENIFYSNTAYYLSLQKVTIQYMDGSVKIINKNGINKIMKTDWEEDGKRVI